ncbi:MAG: DUF4845 domain-containing protein [Gammaproteobacteria bacterium]|nr:DUF4845 domain-containing protein [Gammaproteobacteria bacterium]MDD9896655.1 DUF4845 domain-containing protein [Gammaproteobacteria bacterium]MDD9958309.1 DUF4845 domain-containing protein [Gammaproteobacteria bacterium]
MNKSQCNRLARQRGVSMFGILVLMVMITLFFTVGLKIAPIYINHNLITGICQDLIDNGQAANMTLTEIRATVSNNLRINQIDGFDINNIRMRRENGEAIIMIAYESRIELVANLDVIATFDETLE